MAKRTVCVSAQLEEDLAAKLVEVADKARCSKSWVIREALVEYFKKFDAQQRSEKEFAPLKLLVEKAKQTGTEEARADAVQAVNDYFRKLTSKWQSEDAEQQTQTKPVLDEQGVDRRLNEFTEQGEVVQKRQRTRKR
jgi:metal-responsive CopG/Arc/MetJ family transcriptional regulator